MSKEPIDRLLEILTEMKSFQDEMDADNGKEFMDKAYQQYQENRKQIIKDMKASKLAQDQLKQPEVSNDTSCKRSCDSEPQIEYLEFLRDDLDLIIDTFSEGRIYAALISLGQLFNEVQYKLIQLEKENDS